MARAIELYQNSEYDLAQSRATWLSPHRGCPHPVHSHRMHAAYKQPEAACRRGIGILIRFKCSFCSRKTTECADRRGQLV